MNTQSIPTKNEGSSSKTFSKLCLKNNKTFSKDEQLLLRENVNKDLQIVDLVVGSNYIPESKASTQENVLIYLFPFFITLVMVLILYHN